MFAYMHFRSKNFFFKQKSLHYNTYHKIIASKSETCSIDRVSLFWLCAPTFLALRVELCTYVYYTGTFRKVFSKIHEMECVVRTQHFGMPHFCKWFCKSSNTRLRTKTCDTDYNERSLNSIDSKECSTV